MWVLCWFVKNAGVALRFQSVCSINIHLSSNQIRGMWSVKMFLKICYNRHKSCWLGGKWPWWWQAISQRNVRFSSCQWQHSKSGTRRIGEESLESWNQSQHRQYREYLSCVRCCVQVLVFAMCKRNKSGALCLWKWVVWAKPIFQRLTSRCTTRSS